MLLRPLTALAIASMTSAFFAMDASANPRFHVENNSKKRVNVSVFAGDVTACWVPSKTKTVKAGTGGDTVCSVHEKLKSVGAGNSSSFGCTGNGKNRCQIQLYAGGNGRASLHPKRRGQSTLQS